MGLVIWAAPVLRGAWSVSWRPSAACPRCPWRVDHDLRVAWAAREFRVQAGFRMGPAAAAAATRPDRPGLVLREWLYATHGDADRFPVAGPSDADAPAASYDAADVSVSVGAGSCDDVAAEDKWKADYRSYECVGETKWWADVACAEARGAAAATGTTSSTGTTTCTEDEADRFRQRRMQQCNGITTRYEDDEGDGVVVVDAAATGVGVLRAPRFTRCQTHSLEMFNFE
eukprot:m51a1_g14639 hypothetical protein (229) ;mRNA; f:52694-53380